MDVQIATKPNGLLHAVTIPPSEQEAQRFEAVMKRQGLTVTTLNQAAEAVRFKRLNFAGQDRTPATPSPAEALAHQQAQFDALPARGTTVRYLLDGRPLTGTVSHSLRWPLDHPYCPARVAVVVETPGHTRCVDAGDFKSSHSKSLRLSTYRTTRRKHPLQLPTPLSVQPGRW
ncbi:hypothetical protein [Deinococcus ruber]|uniref:Uncharacterized protein n=1 Tax=Deinococcus ruber TaxID=1848197 RepID=A0A918C884_9DEIO|nr:hypothetical protein [Deinococcus ruber]GGR11546.1 hypothetical protein GCM10008957_25610 [Deinococcus ruber]